MDMNYSEFLDLETGKCAFDTQEFCDLLEYAKQYPEEIDWENMDEDYWMESETAIRDNKELMRYYTVGYFGDMPSAVRGIIRDMNRVGLSGGTFSLTEAVKMVQDNNKRFYDLLDRAFEEA